MMYSITYDFVSFTEWNAFFRKVICHVRSIREVIIEDSFHMRPIDLHTANHCRIDGQGKVYCIDSIKNTLFILLHIFIVGKWQAF